MAFDNLIGNNNIKKILQESVENNKISHSYIFSGEKGIGKKLFAKEFAKMILCQSDEIYPCNKCKSCLEISNNNNPDFSIIDSDEDIIKIEQIRFMLQKVYEKPIISNRKVYIINDSEKMKEPAQNALLKTLEEPPKYITIILICSNISALLPTIKSRCINISFNKLNNEELKRALIQNNIELTNDELLFDIFQGSIQKATYIQQKKDIFLEINKIINNIEKMDMVDILTNSKEIYKNKDFIIEILDYINIIFLKKAKENRFNSKYINCITQIENTKRKIKSNNNFDMSIDNMLIKIWEEVHEKHNRSKI